MFFVLDYLEAKSEIEILFKGFIEKLSSGKRGVREAGQDRK